MGLGDSFDNTTPLSSSKLNKTNAVSGTGAYLAGLDKAKHGLLYCTSTGSGFTLDHLYLCLADGTGVIDVSAIDVHTHSSSSDGGNLIDVLRSNPDVLDSGSYLATTPLMSKWVTAVSGTGAISDVTDGTTLEPYILLDTGATSASTARIKQVGIEWDPSKRSWFKCMTKFGTASSLAIHIGTNMEALSGADNNDRKVGLELCTTTNNNYFATASDGTTRSASDTGTAFGTTRTSFRLEHYPDLGTPKIDLYIAEGTVFTKTTNIPTTVGSNLVDQIMRFAIKNNTAASRTLQVYGTRFVYQTTNVWS
jgi:hypothetical protein